LLAVQKARNLQRIPAKCALYLPSVYLLDGALVALRCHPGPAKLLKSTVHGELKSHPLRYSFNVLKYSRR